MNAKALTIILSIATMVLTACGNDDAIDNWNGEIRLTSGMVAQQTRASFGQDTQLASGQEVSVFVDKTTPSAEKLYGNTVLTAGDNGSLTSSTAMYYPAGGSNVDVYAFHPSLTGSTDYPTTLVHTVNSDQREGAGYLASDLLYAASKDKAKSATAINLTFYHMLSKVEVALKSGTGEPNLTNATVTIEGTKLKASFTPNKTTDISTENNRARMITVSATVNDAAPITIGTKIATGDFGTSTEYAEAVIVPQTVASGTSFIKVVLADATSTTYTYKLDAATTFASGKKYQYKITVNKSALTVTSSITNWVTVGDATNGSAEIQ